MAPSRQEPQDTASEGSQENVEDNHEWREFAESNINLLGGVIEDIITSVENGDKYPDHLVELANTISMISSGFDSLELAHEEKFEQLRAYASGLFVVLWYRHSKSGGIWPPPKFRTPIKEFVETVHGIHELMKRKSEENLAKRVLVGYLGIRDVRKFKKYRGQLGSMASFLENKPNNVNIGDVLLEVINSQAQPQDDNTESSEEVADPSSKKGAKKRSDTQENRAEGSRQRETETPTLAKSIKHKTQPDKVKEDDQRESKASGKKKAKDTTRDDSSTISAEERSVEDNKPVRRKTTNSRLEDEGEAQPKVKRPSKPAKKATQPKWDDEGVGESDYKGKRMSQPSDDYREENNAGVSASEPVTPSVPRKRTKPKERAKTSPAPQHSNSISGISITHSGSGTMLTNNVGNIRDSSISNVGNDHSVNYFQVPSHP